jgi:hypothetical protein
MMYIGGIFGSRKTGGNWHFPVSKKDGWQQKVSLNVYWLLAFLLDAISLRAVSSVETVS